ncbi:MAG: DUF5678 domain-containing protein, partial [Chloroflexota bacterium]|nr:DUF5678 domain-containing protein [Chloroflexota bacterium]
MQDRAFVEETKALLAQANRDADYFDSIYEQVLEEHPDEFVAVYHGKVVAAHKTYEGVVAEIKRQGIRVDLAIIRDFETNPIPLAL